MKFKDLKKLSDEKLIAKKKELEVELMKLRSTVSKGTVLEKPKRIRDVKRLNAKILTILHNGLNKGE